MRKWGHTPSGNHRATLDEARRNSWEKNSVILKRRRSAPALSAQFFENAIKNLRDPLPNFFFRHRQTRPLLLPVFNECAQAFVVKFLHFLIGHLDSPVCRCTSRTIRPPKVVGLCFCRSSRPIFLPNTICLPVRGTLVRPCSVFSIQPPICFGVHEDFLVTRASTACSLRVPPPEPCAGLPQ